LPADSDSGGGMTGGGYSARVPADEALERLRDELKELDG
jgi:prefoldin subunit 5